MAKKIIENRDKPIIMTCQIIQNLSPFWISGVWYVIIAIPSTIIWDKKAKIIVKIILNGNKKYLKHRIWITTATRLWVTVSKFVNKMVNFDIFIKLNKILKIF